MGTVSMSWSAERDGCNRRQRLRSRGVGTAPAAAAGGTRRYSRLAAGQSVLVVGQHGAHAGVHFIDPVGGAAVVAVPPDRCGVVRKRPSSLPGFTRKPGARRVLGFRADLVFFFCLWLLPARSALAR